MDRRLSVEQLEKTLAETIERVRDGREQFVIERDGTPVAAVVSMREYEAMRRSRDRFWELIDLNREANKDVDPAEMEAAIEQAIREVREERRQKRERDAVEG